jgi:hypothetical protein
MLFSNDYVKVGLYVVGGAMNVECLPTNEAHHDQFA